jgi:hypothetical protein
MVVTASGECSVPPSMDDPRYDDLTHIEDEAERSLAAGDALRALRYADRLLAALRRVYDLDHGDVVRWRMFRAEALIDCRRFREAEVDLTSLLGVVGRTEDPESERMLWIRTRLANAVANNGRPDEAVLMAESLLEDRIRLLGPRADATLDTRYDLAGFVRMAGRAGRPEDRYERLLDLWSDEYGDDHPATAAAERWLAASRGAIWISSDLDDCRALADERLAAYGPEHDLTVGAFAALSERLVEVGQAGEAITIARQVKQVRERMSGHDHPDTLSARVVMARAVAADGRVDEAVHELFDVLEAMRRIGVDQELAGCRAMLWILQLSLDDVFGFDHLDARKAQRVASVWRRLHRAVADLPADHPFRRMATDFDQYFRS